MNNLNKIFLIFMLLLPFGIQGQHTFSIVAVDIETGEVGSAGATCLENGASIISGLVPGKGAINSQALVCTPENLNLVKMLGLMEDGMSPDDILTEILANDVCGAEDENYRQYGIVDFDEAGMPRTTAYTGTTADAYANHIIGENYAIQGNILLGPEILEGMEQGFVNTEGSLAEKLMATLQGANVVGADSRCAVNGTSSAGAFLRVACPLDDNDCTNLNLDVFFLAPGVEPIDTLQSLFDAYFDNPPNEAPDNNECVNAQSIELAQDAASCNVVTVNVNGARESFVPITGCDKENVIADVWFAFETGSQLPAEGIVVKAYFDSGNAGEIPSFGCALYNSCRADAFYSACLTSENGADSLVIDANCLEAETTYYLKNWSGDAHLFEDATFDLCVYALNEKAGSFIHWGDEAGQGDFEGGMNDWTTVGTSAAEEVWFWDEDGFFNSLVGVGLQSQTRCNGVMIFHSEFYQTGGFIGNIPAQPYPLKSGELISPIIDLSNATEPTIRFTQELGVLNGNSGGDYPFSSSGTLISYSTDAGTNWSSPQAINPGFAPNEFSSPSLLGEFEIFDAAGSEQVQLKFIYEGDFYFWAIDDVQIIDPAYSITVYDTIQVNNTEYLTINLDGDSVFSIDTINALETDTIFGLIEDSLYTNVVTVYDTIYTTVNDTLDITSINTIELEGLKINLLNNPVLETLHLKIENTTNASKAYFGIYDIEGRLLGEETLPLEGSSIYQKNVASLSAGIYFIRIVLDSGQSQSLRFVKE